MRRDYWFGYLLFREFILNNIELFKKNALLMLPNIGLLHGFLNNCAFTYSSISYWLMLNSTPQNKIKFQQ